MKNLKILVVDDEPIVLESCKAILEAEGFIVSIVKNVSDACVAREKEHFNLLLIEITMQIRNDMYFVEETKKKWPKVPIIMMSGYSTPEMITKSIEMGAARFIAKPFTPDELLTTIHEVIRKEERDRKSVV